MKSIIHVERDINTLDDFQELTTDLLKCLTNAGKEIKIDPKVYVSAILTHSLAALYWYVDGDVLKFREYLNIVEASYLEVFKKVEE